MPTIERHLNSFSLAMFGVITTVFVVMFAGTSMSCGEIHTNVPWAATATGFRGTETDFDVYVKRDNSIYVGQNATPRASLQQALRESVAGRWRRVVLHADAAASYGVVEQVVRAARDTGIREITLITFRGTPLQAMQKGGVVDDGPTRLFF